MSRPTLKLNKHVQDEPAVPTYTADQLRAMLAAIEPPTSVPKDATVDLPIGPTPSHLVADKSALPPPGARTEGFAAQLPPREFGTRSINGIAVLAPQINVNESVNPATGAPYVQVGPRPLGGVISPPPSRRFDGR